MMNEKMTETVYGQKIQRRKTRKLLCEVLAIIGLIAFSIGVIWLLKGVDPKNRIEEKSK